ncbi:phosphatidate phosphatase APP1 [Conyzicola lurida]|uniref:Phosphatidate phosphatase APP1 n=1 Tax=Conyzicola lurida TaxID=1172621 RepID=A0A841AP25_9MICO|nr:phosphatase domain-containing protein [Conyzicola lurida]MBB5843446.1 phosphatidate phosphatase APP1 [Conyzicola lurida]
MARSRKALADLSDASQSASAPILHFAARLEDSMHAWREKRGRKRGLKTTIIPYTGYGSPGWVRVLCRIVLTRGDVASQRAAKVRGWRSFFSIPVDDVEVTIIAGGVEQKVLADRGGVVDTRIDVQLTPGWHTITIRTDDTEAVSAPVFIIDPSAEFGIVSDVDDTVMVTALPRPLLAAWNTFVLDEHARRPVPGMAVMYERLLRANPSAPVIYLSTGAWNVAPTLTRFFERNLYPAGPLLLTDWGPTHDRWFRSGRQHKVSSLDRLAEELPGMKWLLVGDDGQHDEEIYADFAARHPTNVAAVAIRQLSPSEAVLAGGRSRAVDQGAADIPWVFAPDGAGLIEQLASDTEIVTGPRR